MRKKLRSNIANFITLLNLLCGSFSIYFMFKENYALALVFILAAVFFDFTDGLVARLLKINSEIGKQLDSLADVISFGLAPGVAMFLMLSISIHNGNYLIPEYFSFISFIIPLFSAWRLAKFNTDSRQENCFYGLPTPAMALFVFSVFATYTLQLFSPLTPWKESFISLIKNPYFLIVITLLLSVLMVVNLRLFALKFKDFTWKKNKFRYIFIALSFVLILLFYFFAIPFIIILYIFISLIENIINRKRKP